MKIMCCNVRYSAARDGENHWFFRYPILLDVFGEHDPDIICFQEMSRWQYSTIRDGLKIFSAFGMVDEPQGFHPVNAIFYRTNLFKQVSAGGYWLSETPHIPGTKSWNSACVRLCNWVRLIDQSSGKELRIVNTHLDHISQEARVNQARLINQDAAAYASAYPQILTGDMNCNIENPAIQSFLQAGWNDTYETFHKKVFAGNSFHGFRGEYYSKEEGKIDFIFHRGNIRVDSAEIITESRNGRFPSDHYFVSVDISL
ncbi:MAG TPA: endonuclease/exonuclease/phosphatase family protein [Anaerolineaceae bacterium]